ncbi:hypothetical protein JRO89_XSUnG0223700 [Xanthoceras sorbifolium]|uniref:Mic1 domain-containing protein n=1 Tax=Xanthoceras sorbifolium TaxID=99658 RepID=A0ABQ8GWX2_9ROSI|nr:hypothetical protein JRO89_XSUnG0223700 [Xanthoceras sorbifolium]
MARRGRFVVLLLLFTLRVVVLLLLIVSEVRVLLLDFDLVVLDMIFECSPSAGFFAYLLKQDYYSRAPISAPLPLLLRGFPRSYSSSRFRDGENLEVNNTGDHDSVIYGDNWTFLVPDLICDVSNKCLWKIHLDLEAIAASSSEVPSVLEFLQRRKLETYKAKQLCLGLVRTVILERRPVSVVARAIDVLVTSYSHSIKTGSYFKGLKNETTTPSSVPNANSPVSITDVSTNRIDGLGKSIRHGSAAGIDSESLNRSSTFSASESEDVSSFVPLKTNSNDLQLGGHKVNRASLLAAESANEVQPSSLKHPLPGPSDNPINANISEQQDSQLTSPAISPDEMYRFVFAPAEEEMVGDPSYLVSIIVEFLRSANLEKIKIYPNLYVLTVQLLARYERYAELGLFIINKILEPSKEVALQLLESGRQNIQTRKLGLDMLRQLSLHLDYVLLLVQDGYYREALRYARKHKVTTVRPSLFLEAAFASNDSQHLAAVLRFFSDFIPDFHNTSDFSSYHRLLNEMNSSIAI